MTDFAIGLVYLDESYKDTLVIPLVANLWLYNISTQSAKMVCTLYFLMKYNNQML
jgi:hypothetical protein